jgi:predicted metal-dependent hydrolase
LSTPKARTPVYLKIMIASAVGPRSASENLYRSLHADFDAAYKNMTDSSREFSAVLMDVTAELSPEERRSRTDSAAQAYQDAHERFKAAVSKLTEYAIGQIISSRSKIHLVVPHR